MATHSFCQLLLIILVSWSFIYSIKNTADHPGAMATRSCYQLRPIILAPRPSSVDSINYCKHPGPGVSYGFYPLLPFLLDFHRFYELMQTAWSQKAFRDFYPLLQIILVPWPPTASIHYYPSSWCRVLP